MLLCRATAAGFSTAAPCLAPARPAPSSCRPLQLLLACLWSASRQGAAIDPGSRSGVQAGGGVAYLHMLTVEAAHPVDAHHPVLAGERLLEVLQPANQRPAIVRLRRVPFEPDCSRASTLTKELQQNWGQVIRYIMATKRTRQAPTRVRSPQCVCHIRCPQSGSSVS